MQWDEWTQELIALYGYDTQQPEDDELEMQKERKDNYIRMKEAVLPVVKAKYRQKYEDATSLLADLAEC